jgi:hypothetical protein
MSFVFRGAQGMSFALPADAAVARFGLLAQIPSGASTPGGVLRRRAARR